MNKHIAWRWQVTSQNKITLLTSFLSEPFFFSSFIQKKIIPILWLALLSTTKYFWKIQMSFHVPPSSSFFEKFYRCIIIAQRKKERRLSSVDSQVNQFAKGNTWFDGTQQPITWVMGSCGTSFALCIDPQFACNYFKTFPDIFFITIMSISLSVLAKKL